MISVVIPYFNDPMIKECFDALMLNSEGFELKTIVIDNRDTNNPLPIDPDIIIVNEKNVGYTKATNQGIKESEGDLILLLNADAIMHDGCLHTMVDLISSDDSFALVGPAEGNVDGSLYQLPDIGRTNKVYEDYASYLVLQWVSFGCVLLKRSTIEKIGMLNDNFPHRWSDLEYCKRINAKGLKVLYSKDCGYTHFRQGSGEPEILYEFLFDLLMETSISSGGAIRFKKLELPNSSVVAAVKNKLGQKVVITSLLDDKNYIFNLEDADIEKNILIFSGRRDKANLYLKGYYGNS